MDRVCAVCGSANVQRCHVKDKAEFRGRRSHDFHNIIYLCAEHHYAFFDKERMAIVPGGVELLVLRCKKFRRIDSYEPKGRIVVKGEYIEWKNTRVHPQLKAELRKKRREAAADIGGG